MFQVSAFKDLIVYLLYQTADIFSDLFHQLDLTRPPSLVDPGLQRAIHAQDNEPALARDGFQPVFLFARGRFGSEVDVV